MRSTHTTEVNSVAPKTTVLALTLGGCAGKRTRDKSVVALKKSTQADCGKKRASLGTSAAVPTSAFSCTVKKAYGNLYLSAI